MIENPVVSVILPVYNCREYVGAAVRSILDQTFPNFELLVIDDGSDRETELFLRESLPEDERLVLLRNHTNLGLIATLNRGLETARGRYIARMDADDIAYPDRLALQVSVLEENPDLFLVGGSFYYIDAEGRRLGTQSRAYSPEQTARYLLKSGIVHHPTVLFRNQGDYRYREKALYCEDRDLWLRMISDGRKLCVLKDIVLDYRVHPGSISARKYARQAAFVDQVTAWHRERLKHGHDSYDRFDPQPILAMETHSEQYLEVLEMKILFKSGRERQRLRAKIRRFWRIRGFGAWKPAWVIYPLSFLPAPIERVLVRWIVRAYE
ncbi:MAG: glycosyltransferase family 2 protein [Acidobacteriota bacterium]|nr:glycosyltransferase family 2 protein [Acidobacteriota bacterium]